MARRVTLRLAVVATLIDLAPPGSAYHGPMSPALRTALALILIAEATSCSSGHATPPVADAGPGPDPDAGVPPIVKPPQVPDPRVGMKF